MGFLDADNDLLLLLSPLTPGAFGLIQLLKGPKDQSLCFSHPRPRAGTSFRQSGCKIFALPSSKYLLTDAACPAPERVARCEEWGEGRGPGLGVLSSQFRSEEPLTPRTTPRGAGEGP